jgi:hypothetical protein
MIATQQDQETERPRQFTGYQSTKNSKVTRDERAMTFGAGIKRPADEPPV